MEISTTPFGKTPTSPVLPLGSTSLLISRISLGTVALGLDYGIPTQGAKLRPETADAARLLQSALDLGVKLIDTARTYGESEEIIGAAIGHRRKDYVLATKVSPFPGQPFRVRESVHASLRALRTDVLDLVQIHCAASDPQPDPATTDELLELKRSGEIRFLGASVYSEESVQSAMESGQFDCLQVAYSALDRRLEVDLLPAAGRAHIGVLARSVLLKGALTDRAGSLPDTLEPLRNAVRDIWSLASGEVESLPELAYRYALSNPAIDSVLAGVTTLQELEQAILWASRGPLSFKLLDAIRRMPPLSDQMLTPAFWPPLS